jgi:aminoglycoside phosphotransferase family enzyme/predicted kinase
MGTLVDDLRDGLVYDPPAARIDFAETHASWVFLTEREAFKVKRPVDLGFLDFTTLERRERACRDEVALNARLAPDVYLGVVPVRRDAQGRHRVGQGEGTIVDWAVRMVRLPDDARGDVLVARGALSVGAVDAIAGHLAAFHARARADEETARYGAPEAIERNVRENFAQTKDLVTAYVSRAEADAIQAWQLGVLDRDRATFERRARQARVRDGHGDLRLEHVYVRGEGAPTIIDCIEFTERFRFGDVCSDVAFLAMDLAWHGRVDLAERLLARYARESDDFDLYALVDFYESYRAYVRAKVSAMLAADRNASDEARARGAREARRYLMLALAAGRRSLLAPSLVAVGGIIASGKSSLADWVGARMAAPVVDADRTRKHMLGVAPTTPVHEGAWRGAYGPSFTSHVYQEVLRRAEVVLESGRPVVVEASFRSAEMRRAARELAAKRGAPFLFVECRAPADVCRERLAARERKHGVSDGRLEIFDAFVERWEPVNEFPPSEHAVVDTSRTKDEAHAAVESRLVSWPRT